MLHQWHPSAFFPLIAICRLDFLNILYVDTVNDYKYQLSPENSLDASFMGSLASSQQVISRALNQKTI